MMNNKRKRVEKPNKMIFENSIDLELDNNSGRIIFKKEFLSKEECKTFNKVFMEKIKWEKKKIKIYGKEIFQPRLVAFSNKYHNSYPYSGQILESQEWIPEINDLASKLGGFLDEDFDSVQMNLYEDGNHHICSHSDDEPLWGEDPTIASLSFGAPRRFLLKSKKSNDLKEFVLTDGSLIVMKGKTQKFWKHEVPKMLNCTKPRINLTFRKMKKLII